LNPRPKVFRQSFYMLIPHF